MLGIPDGWVVLAYLLCILSSILCVVYGALNWNRGEEPVTTEDVRWALEEREEIEEEL
ncbi:MAG: hypothetical protein PVJ27_00235 [Candidatus Brocadiaceae bacterium]|jgi:hypothetical protein